MAKVLSITFNDDWIKITEESGSAKGVQIYGATTIKTPEGAVEDGSILKPEDLSGAISAELARNEMGSRNVIFSIQSSKIASKEVQTPAVKEPKLSNYIKNNARDIFPVNIDEYIITYSVLETVETTEGKKHRVMVVAAPADIVSSYYELARTLGLTVQDIDYLGNSNLQLTRLQIDARPSIVIQIGEDSTSVSILSKNMLRLMRNVPYGKSTVAQALIEKKDSENLSMEDAYKMMAERQVIHSSFADNEYVTDSLRYLVNNISRVLDYYTGKNSDEPIEIAYVFTEGPGIVGIETLFHDELNGIEVKLIEHLVDVDTSAANIPESSVTLYYTNIGAVIAPVNFIPMDAVEKARKASSGKYFRLILYAAVFIAVLIVGLPFFQQMEKSAELADLQSKIASLQYVKQIVADYYNAKDELTDVETFEQLAVNYDDDLIDFVEFLESSMPSDISITNMSVNSGSVSMSLTGSAKETVAAFIVTLESNPSIEEVNVPSVSESVDSNGNTTVSYTLTCVFTGTLPEAEETGAGDATPAASDSSDDDIMSDYNE